MSHTPAPASQVVRLTCTTVVLPPVQRSPSSTSPASRKALRAFSKSPCRSPIATRRGTAGRRSGGGGGRGGGGCCAAAAAWLACACGWACGGPVTGPVACGGRAAAGPCAWRTSVRACTKPCHSCVGWAGRAGIGNGAADPASAPRGAGGAAASRRQWRRRPAAERPGVGLRIAIHPLASPAPVESLEGRRGLRSAAAASGGCQRAWRQGPAPLLSDAGDLRALTERARPQRGTRRSWHKCRPHNCDACAPSLVVRLL